MNDFSIDLELTHLASKLADLYRSQLRNGNHVSSGKLINFQEEITIDDERLLITFNLPHYWKYIEEGRKPGKQPPISAIQTWIENKGIVPYGTSSKVPNTKQLAFVIARSIGKKGIPGKYPLKKTLESPQTDEIIRQIIENLTDQVIRIINDKK